MRFRASLHISKPTKRLKLSTFKYSTNSVDWDKIREQFVTEMNLHLPMCPNFDDMNTSHLDEYIDQFTSSIQSTCGKLFPKSRGPPEHAPWWNDNLKELKKSVIRIHHKLSKAVRRKQPLEQLVEERKRLRRQYSDAFCAASTEHFKEFCGRQKKEDVWSVTNRIIKTRPLVQAPATLRLDDGTYTKDSHDTARALLDRFYPDDTADTDAQNRLRTEMYTPIHSHSEPPFTLDEILDCLQSMNVKRAPGVDHLTPHICFWVANWFPKEVLGIMNSIATGSNTFQGLGKSPQLRLFRSLVNRSIVHSLASGPSAFSMYLPRSWNDSLITGALTICRKITPLLQTSTVLKHKSLLSWQLITPWKLLTLPSQLVNRWLLSL